MEWPSLPLKSFFPLVGRYVKSCRKHWLLFRVPTIKRGAERKEAPGGGGGGDAGYLEMFAMGAAEVAKVATCRNRPSS